MAGKKVFITGVSGYLGTRLCLELDRLGWCEKIFGMDLIKPLYKYDKLEFRKMDINDPALVEWAREIKPDILVHLAYILEQLHNLEKMRRINYDGSLNALQAAARAETPQLLFASSGTAYGARPDNPVELKESDPLKPNPGFFYAVDKARMETALQEFSRERPQTIVSVIRPCVVYGPNVNNYLSDLLDMPILTGFRGLNPRLQFVHEDDVARAIIFILEKNAPGFFNIAPPDTTSLEEMFQRARKLSVMLPNPLMNLLVSVFWHSRIPLFRISPAFLDYLRYPWVMNSSRLTGLGFQYRYSTNETIEIMLRVKELMD